MNEDTPHKEKKRISRWKLFGLILFSAILMVLYVSNVLYVDSELEEIQSLKKIYNSYRNGNELLKTDIIKLESAERIIPLAEKELGMMKSDKPPSVLQLDVPNNEKKDE
ncbi:MAG: hypothetical protein EPN82_09405 [Bacteroidetes bacterium]|nr:MAG: hypothetical protein EPN82_09405 [Bacteroidota bacterium]